MRVLPSWIARRRGSRQPRSAAAIDLARRAGAGCRLTRASPPIKGAAGASARLAHPRESMAVEPRLLANAIRALAMDAVQAANSGHPGMPMGMADVATILFTEYLNYDPRDPRWPDRDRFILSAGHGSMLLYALLYLTGYQR